VEQYRLCKVAEDGQRIEFEELVCRDDGHAVHLAKRLVQDHDVEVWNGNRFVFRLECKKTLTMTNVQQQDARLIAMDEATVAAIRLHVPEFEAAYLDDNLPRWFQRLLDRCTTTAEHAADPTDAAFIETLSSLLVRALGRSQAIADHDAPGIVPEARSLR